MSIYKPRIADKLLEDALESKGAVLIQGPKWCGKTTTAMQIAKSAVRMDDPKKNYVELAGVQPSYILEGDVPHLIDEWQLYPKLWDAVRFEVDSRQEFGQFILTGSSVPPEPNQIYHSGTGRISRLTMSTMTLYESGDSSGSVSIQELFEGNDNILGINPVDAEKLAFLVCRGGWPLSVGQSEKIALRQARDYYDSLVENDVSRFDGRMRNMERTKLLLRSYARHSGTQAGYKQIAEDISSNDAASVSDESVASYIDVLRKLFVVSELEAWNPNIRSKIAIRTTNTRYFTDPSIAAAALGSGPKDLFNDLNTFGFLFETMCIRDLRVYSQYLDGDLYHYRDSSGLECDAVIHLRNGKWGAFEIKLGTNENDKAAKNLIKLSNKVDTDRMNPPSFLAVISGTASYAYKRDDGVLIIPVGCLKY